MLLFAVFFEDEGACGEAEEEVGLFFGEGVDRVWESVIAGGTGGVLCAPEVFADGQSDAGGCVFEDSGAGAGGEVAGFIEDVVVWEEAFVVGEFDGSVA